MAFRCFKSMCGKRRSNSANNISSASSDQNDQSPCCGCVTKFYSSSASASASASANLPANLPTKNEGSLSSGISVAAAAESSTSTEFAELCSLLVPLLPRNATHQLMDFIASKLPPDTRRTFIEDKGVSSTERGFMEQCRVVAEKFLAIACDKDLRQIASKALESLGQSNWMLFGLACIGAALDRTLSIDSNDTNCFLLLRIMNTTATTLKNLQKFFAEDNNQVLKHAFEIIVENSVICFEYLSQTKAKKFLKAKTMEQQLQDAKYSITAIMNSVDVEVGAEILRITKNLKHMLSYHVTPIADILEGSPVGLDQEIEKVSGLLNITGTEEPAVALVIWGVGGIGKSTLAAASVKRLQNENELSQKYKFAKIMFDNTVTQAKHSHIAELQKQILHRIFPGKTEQIANPVDGRHALKEALQKHSCFLFIDNVNETEDVSQLLPKELCLVRGVMLRMIITSRVQEVKAEVPQCCVKKIYQRHHLSDQLSEHLLKTTVMGPVTEEFRFAEEMDMLRKVAHLCCGIPLLLTVVGGKLSEGRDSNTYGQFIQKLEMGNVNFKNVNYEKIEEILLFAVKKMEISSREDFTDICCWFFSEELGVLNENVEEWKYFCWLMGESTMKNMRDKGLVKIGQDGEIVIHDILQSMAQKDSANKYILENSEWKQILEDEAAKMELKGLSLSDETLNCQDLDVAHKSLRYLALQRVIVAGQCMNKFDKLKGIWLYKVESDHFFFKHLPSLRNLTSLVIKEAICLEELPIASCNSLPHLSILTLSKCPNLKTLPNDIGGLTALKSLLICFCERLTGFPENLEGLKSLQRLEIRQCPIAGSPSGFRLPSSLETCNLEGTKLKELTHGTCGKLLTLSYLRLVENNELRALPLDFEGLQSLRKLSIKLCPVEELPSSFCRLSSLQICKLLSTNLKTLPDDFGELVSLRQLHIWRCSVEMFPSSFARLPALQQLSIKECPIKELPPQFGKLTSLQGLSIKECPIKELPPSFGKLTSLRSCSLGCTKLKKIPMCIGLSSLEALYLDRNDELQALPEDFGALHSLIRLCICDCPVRELPFTFSQLSSLISCHLEGTELKYLPCGVCSGLSSLKSLTLKRNYKMSVLPEDFGGLQSLRRLTIRQCPLREFPSDFSRLTALDDEGLDVEFGSSMKCLLKPKLLCDFCNDVAA